MVMIDRKNKRLVEFNSTPEYDLKAVIADMDTYEENGIQLRKYFNEDLPLLEQNMTPAQFEQIETAHKRMLRLEREALALKTKAPVKRVPLSPPVYYEKQVEEMDRIIGKFQRVGEDQRLPVRKSSSLSSSSLYEFEIGQDLLDDTLEVLDL